MPELEQNLAHAWPLSEWNEVTVLVAVSGGPDSVALLRALAAIKSGGAGRLLVAHYNHRLRGNAALEDAAFVQCLAAKLGLGCTVGQAVAAPKAAGESLEGVLRNERYAFLQATAEQHGARFVATGHTADDQVETILHRVIRGTGVGGLAGILPARSLGPAVSLVRPLLSVTRAQVMEYLAALGQTFRQDASNQEPHFTRNRLRHELLPLLERDFNPHVREALLRLGALAGEAQAVIEEQVSDLERAVVKYGRAGTVEISPTGGAARYVVCELFQRIWATQGWPTQDMNAARWRALADLMLVVSPGEPPVSEPPPREFPGGVCAKKQGGKLTLSRPAK